MPTSMNISLPEAMKDFVDELDSGEDIPATPEFWENLRRDLLARRANKKKMA